MNNLIKISLFIGLFAAFSFLNSCQEIIAPDSTTQFGKLKSETKWKVGVIDGEKEIKIHHIDYDINGKVILNEEYNKSGAILQSSNYEHSQNETKEIICIFNDSGAVINKATIIYAYDALGKVTKRTQLDKSGSVLQVSLYDYDLNGNVISKTDINPNGSSTSKTNFSYSYNKQGELIEKLTLADGETQSRDSLVYELNNKQLIIYTFDNFGFIKSYFIYHYNNFGLITEESKFSNDDKIISRYKYEYLFY